MNKVIIVIGQSASGKTTYIRKNYIEDYEKGFIDKPFKMTRLLRRTEKWLLLGHHQGEKRCEGSDELSMAILPQLIEFVKTHINDYDVMVFDGDRINNEKFFRFVADLNKPVELYVLTCSLQTSIKRREEAGSKPSETFVKTTITKSNNMKRLGIQLGFKVEVIKTDDSQSGLMSFIGG